MVSVPVLSVQRTSMAPRFWIELQPLDDHLLARHGQSRPWRGRPTRSSAASPASGRRPPPGRRRRLLPVPLGQAVDDEDQRHHDDHEADHQPGEPADAAVEAGRRLLLHDGAWTCRRGRSSGRWPRRPPWRRRSRRWCPGSRRCSVPGATGPRRLPGRRISRRETIRRSGWPG